MSKAVHISRKHEVQRRIVQTRRQLESVQREPSSTTALGRYFEEKRIKRQIARLQTTLDSLMAQEYRLRQEIDQSR